MKKVIFVLVAVFGFHFCDAQVFSIGPRFGLSSSKVQVDNILSGDQKISEGDKVLGFHGGLYSRLQIPGIGLYIQPEALFTSSGGKINISDNGNISVSEYKFNKLDVPVMVGFRFFKVLRVNAGPTFNFLLSASETTDGIENDVINDHSNSIGYQAGIGLDLWRIILDLKYENSLSSFGDSMFGIPTDHRNPQIIFSMGFRL
jgi:hypothetical protein